MKRLLALLSKQGWFSWAIFDLPASGQIPLVFDENNLVFINLHSTTGSSWRKSKVKKKHKLSYKLRIASILDREISLDLQCLCAFKLKSTSNSQKTELYLSNPLSSEAEAYIELETIIKNADFTNFTSLVESVSPVLFPC